MKRVSMRREEDGTPLVNSRSKCFTHVIPLAKDQLPSGVKPIFVAGEPRNQRVLCAPSDQNGALMSYGTTPAAAVSVCVGLVKLARFVKAPVPESVSGMEAPVALFVS